MKLTLFFDAIGAGDTPIVGGKGANLGALACAGVPVPPGFCVTTHAYELFVAQLPDADARFRELDTLDGPDVDAARRAAQAMRAALDKLPMPDDVTAAVRESWRELGVDDPLAVRSSATAEDLPAASFAGQQDTYLNVRGEAALLDAVRRCWISLFTDRAVLYRARNGFGHRAVKLAVVVQKLIDPDVSGILFTADPVSGHRGIASIEAGFGLGEALVSGLIDADLYKVDRRSRRILLAQPGDKAVAIRSVPGGGTRQEPLPDAQRRARALDDAQVLALMDAGERVERLYDGEPQDIEWCIAGGKIFVVQARPITSLFPIPRSPAHDRGLRIFISFGHLQMMLDAIPRLSIDTWRLFLPAGKGRAPTLRDRPKLSVSMVPAAGRLFLDVTPILRVSLLRAVFLGMLQRAYPDLARAASILSERDAFRDGRGHPVRLLLSTVRILGPVLRRVPFIVLAGDPMVRARRFDDVVDELPEAAAARNRSRATPAERVRQCAVEISAVFTALRPHLSVMVAGLVAHTLLARSARASWAKDVRGNVDVLLRGLPGNVTTEMDLVVGDLTDFVRTHRALGAVLDGRRWQAAHDALRVLDGGPEFLDNLDRFLDRYGDRVAGEIDLSRPRWRDDPTQLLRVIAGGLTAGDRGGHRRQYHAQVAAANAAAARLVAAARRGPMGFARAWWIGRLVRVARAGLGLREHPKFTIVRLLGVVRAEVIAAGQQLAARGQLREARDVWHLGFDELADALADPSRDLREIARLRGEQFQRDRTRRPPIAISSDGEIPSLAGEREGIPANALPGTGASAGVAEGIARVVTDPQREVLHAGEILVAQFTDPGWTPLFVHAAGVVTEVGGLMTHGAVVAREYGIPAVVSVDSAVQRIRTGQRIRVDGTQGFVEILGG